MKNTPISLFLATIATALTFTLTSPVSARSTSKKLEPDSFVEVSRQVLPAVVNITISSKTPNRTEEEVEEELRRFFSERQGNLDDLFMGDISGSGVLINKKGEFGYVLTNNHVVAPLNEASVMTLTFHQQGEGTNDYNLTTEVTGDDLRVIGRDKLSDLAVIEFLMPKELENVQPAQFADSDEVEIGEFVLALGNPLNFNHTITQGIISGKSRYLGSQISLTGLLQTDAVIQPGNSGGPLVNLDGKIVGINNAIVSRTGLWQGTSFAIPSKDAKRIYNQLMKYGRVERGYLGVTMENVSGRKRIVDAFQLEKPLGVLIKFVVPNSPADLAGIHKFDVITHIEDFRVKNSDDMLRVITSKDIDEEVSIKLVRLGDDEVPVILDVVAVLAERPNEEVILDLHSDDLRDQIIPLIPEEKHSKNVFAGMKLSESKDPDSGQPILEVQEIVVGSVADEAGVEKGDILTYANSRAVRTLDDFKSAFTKNEQGRLKLTGLRNDGTLFTFDIKLPDED